MPCFDKKLEAARPEFGCDTEENTYRDVDCVITAKEIVQLLMAEGIAFETLNDEPIDTSSDKPLAPMQWPIEQQWTSHPGSSSGGYMDFVIQGIQQRIDEPTRIEIIPGKNSDITEYRVVSETDSSKIHFRTARIYGFRNIQNLVRKLKQNGGSGGRPGKAGLKMARARVISRRTPAAQALSDASEYDYVEVMACPGGCVNGGGQIGMPTGKNAKEWRDELEILYGDIEEFSKTLLVNNKKSSYSVTLSKLATSWVELLWDKQPRDSLLHVEYHAVNDTLAITEDPNIAPLALGTKW